MPSSSSSSVGGRGGKRNTVRRIDGNGGSRRVQSVGVRGGSTGGSSENRNDVGTVRGKRGASGSALRIKNSSPIGNASAAGDVTQNASAVQVVDANQSNGQLVPGGPILLQGNNQSLQGSSRGGRATRGSGRGGRQSGRGGNVVQRIRQPIQAVPVEPFVLDAFARNGKPLHFPGSMKHAYEAAARFFETIYADIPKMFGVPRPYEWKKEKFVCNYDEFRSFITALNIRLEDMTSNQHHGLHYPRRFKRLESSPKLSLSDAIDVLDFAYSMAVPNPAVLNGGRDSQTYGEVSPRQMASIFNELQLTSEDVFLDLGSGVGQLVMLASIITPVKESIGIESFETPAKIAAEQQMWFSRTLEHIGKNHMPFELIHDDFTKPEHMKHVLRATVIFINNLVFEVDLMAKIKKMLISCENGTRIITTEKLAHRTTNADDVVQDLEDIGTFVEERILKCIGKGCVSWTDKPVKFYLYTIKRK